MIATIYSWMNVSGGHTPPHLNLVTDAYHASYYNHENFNKKKQSTNKTLLFIGKNKFLHSDLTIPVPANSEVIGI